MSQQESIDAKEHQHAKRLMRKLRNHIAEREQSQTVAWADFVGEIISELALEIKIRRGTAEARRYFHEDLERIIKHADHSATEHDLIDTYFQSY